MAIEQPHYFRRRLADHAVEQHQRGIRIGGFCKQSGQGAGQDRRQTLNGTREVYPGSFWILERNVAKVCIGPDAGRFANRYFANNRSAFFVRDTGPYRLIWTACGFIGRQCALLGSSA